MTGGPITRSTVVARTGLWLPNTVEYSQSETDSPTGHRKDCSGYVSMCLDLPTPGLSTVSLVTSGAVYPIGWEEIQPGDLIGHLGEGTSGNDGHVRLYIGRTESGAYQWWEQAIGSTGPDLSTSANIDTSWYAPYRYVNIREDDMGLQEWTADPNGDRPAWALSQGSPTYAGQQRDTALAFTWQSANEANQKADQLLKLGQVTAVAAVVSAVVSVIGLVGRRRRD
jgi:hypothetical protein